MRLWGRLFRRAVPSSSDRRDPIAASGQRLFVDLSTIAQQDAGTGIQRVVRSIWNILEGVQLDRFSVVAVAATAKRGYCLASIDGATIELPAPDAPLLDVGEGDIFLGLDLAAHRFWRHRRQIGRWKRRGATVAVVIYDLLPLREPDWFPASTVRHFGRWIRVIMRWGDVAFCISRQVANDLTDLLREKRVSRMPRLRIAQLPLCGDIRGSRPTSGIGDVGADVLARMARRPTLLMVGTIEPRKAHTVLIDAFDHLRTLLGETAPDLVIAGRPGWRTEVVQRRMLEHPARGGAFHWISDASDELLTALYDRAALVVVPSFGEGFGLPVVEALAHGRKVLARDIPVFRELARPGLGYFASDAPEALAASIVESLKQSDPLPGQAVDDWTDSVVALLDGLGIDHALCRGKRAIDQA